MRAEYYHQRVQNRRADGTADPELCNAHDSARRYQRLAVSVSQVGYIKNTRAAMRHGYFLLPE